MEFSESLTAQLYLLAYDPRKQRLPQAMVEYLLRAAALADLQFRGRLADEAGTVQVSSREPVGEPMLDAVLRHIVKSKPRSWQRWIGPELLGFKRETLFRRAVRDRLATLRVIELESGSMFVIFPSSRVIVPQPSTLTQLTTGVRDALRDTQPVSHVHLHDAALVALAAAARLKSVLPWQERWAHRKRIAQLSQRTGPVVFALRDAIWQASSVTNTSTVFAYPASPWPPQMS